jgi:GT2 family glycosyltransferase
MKIGIVSISFNQGKYLAEAIESVSLADPARLAYVIVDPGSTDDSREIIERYRRRFSRIIFEPDQGPADGLNKGFATLDADILGYVNSDDRFAPGALDYVLRYFERHPSADALCGAIRIIGERGRPSLRRRTPDPIDLRRYAYESCFFWQQATFFRREAFLKAGGFNIANETAWDGELVVDMALAGCRFGYTNKLLGDFRIYGDSITGSGRLSDALRRDRQHMREKILRAGIPRASQLEVRVMQYLYKFNLRRHWSYLFDGEELEAQQ